MTVAPGWIDRSYPVDVEVYERVGGMLAVVEREHGKQPIGTDAVTHCFRDGSEPFALIRVAKDTMSLEVVVHEATHTPRSTSATRSQTSSPRATTR